MSPANQAEPHAESSAAITLPAWCSLCRYDSLGSTNDEAKRLAEAGAAHGTIVWALEQTAGRGRMDRSWSSPRGNLFMTLILRPVQPAHEAAGIGFVAALAVADTVAGLLPSHVPVGLKWPNDVLVDGRKAAGILLEASANATGHLDWLVLGIGVNLADAPKAALYPTAALSQFMPAQSISAPSPTEALAKLAAAFDRRFALWNAQGFGGIREDWLVRAHPRGTHLTIRRPDGELNGRFADLDGDGTLILETESGLVKVTAGDVYLPDAHLPGVQES